MAEMKDWALNSRENEPEMLDRFYRALRVKMEHTRGSGEHAELLERLDGMLEGSPPSWKKAYEIQELMTELWDDDMLDLEIQRSLTQGRKYLQVESHAFYSRRASETDADDTGGKRALLRSLLSDLHWRKTLAELAKRYLRSYRARVGLLCLATLVLVLSSLTVRAYYLGGGLNENILHRIQGRMDIFYLLYASLVGIWGATFSMLTGAKRGAEEMDFSAARNIYSWSSILSRIAIGAGGGLLMYFFIKAELVAGGVMPKFTVPDGMEELVGRFLKASRGTNQGLINSLSLELSDKITTRDIKIVPLLTVWAFIAGFSEKLVPSILSRTQAKIQGSDSSPPGKGASTPAPATTPARNSATKKSARRSKK